MYEKIITKPKYVSTREKYRGKKEINVLGR